MQLLQKKPLSLYSQCKRLKRGSMWDCKWGQARPRQPWDWRYTFTGWHGTLWLSLCCRAGTRKAGGGAVGLELVCMKRKDSSLQMGKKGQLVTKSLVQPSWLQGRIPLWLDSFWRFPQIFTHNVVHRHQAGEQWRESSRQLSSLINSVY